MAGCAVQRARKVQRGITVQLTLGCWLGDMADSTLSLVQLSEPHFLPLPGRSQGAEWPTVAGMALPWARGLLENSSLGRTGVEAVALSLILCQHLNNAVLVESEFVTLIYGENLTQNPPAITAALWDMCQLCPVSFPQTIRGIIRILLRKKCCLLQVALFSPIWSRNLLKCCCGMWLWLKFAGGWILLQGQLLPIPWRHRKMVLLLLLLPCLIFAPVAISTSEAMAKWEV